jgi:hypothetical protein
MMLFTSVVDSVIFSIKNSPCSCRCEGQRFALFNYVAGVALAGVAQGKGGVTIGGFANRSS